MLIKKNIQNSKYKKKVIENITPINLTFKTYKVFK